MNYYDTKAEPFPFLTEIDDEEIRNVLKSMLTKDPAQRITARRALEITNSSAGHKKLIADLDPSHVDTMAKLRRFRFRVEAINIGDLDTADIVIGMKFQTTNSNPITAENEDKKTNRSLS